MNVCLLFLQEKSGTHAQHLTHKALKTWDTSFCTYDSLFVYIQLTV
jgi:hypothetical protein